MAQAKVDTSQFSEICRQLANTSAKPLGDVVRSEVAKVLERCITLTPKANKGAVERQVAFRNRSLWDNGDPKRPKNRGHQIGYVTKTGTQWFAEEPTGISKAQGKKMGGRVFYDMNGLFRWNNQRWQRWQANLAAMQTKQLNVAKIVRSIGLAKESWYQIAVQLGIANQVKAPAYVKNAVAQTGVTYVNGSGKIIDTAKKFLLEGENRHPSVVTRMNGDGILALALAGRVKFFEKNFGLAVFSSLYKTAKKYPGLKINAQPDAPFGPMPTPTITIN